MPTPYLHQVTEHIHMRAAHHRMPGGEECVLNERALICSQPAFTEPAPARHPGDARRRQQARDERVAVTAVSVRRRMGPRPRGGAHRAGLLRSQAVDAGASFHG